MYDLSAPDWITKTHQVLVVEDNEDNLLLLTFVLQQYYCSWMTAKDGMAALSVAREIVPDLILLDIVLPQLDGLELARLLKQNRATCRIPIIVITGLIFPDEQAQIEEAGCDAYLSKPYRLGDLEKLLDRYLQRKSALGGDWVTPFKNSNNPSPSGLDGGIAEEVGHFNLHPLL